MKTIVLIGMTGEGKSPVVKKMIEEKKCFVFDIQNEYGKKPKYPGQTPINLSNDITKERSRHVQGNHLLFMKQAKKKKGTIIVFEDSTGFIEGRLSSDLRTLITNKMFTRNTYIFSFHSISSVPPRIMQLTDIVILFNTNDEFETVRKKYRSLYDDFVKLKNKELKAPVVITTGN